MTLLSSWETRSALSAISSQLPCLAPCIHEGKNFRQDGTSGLKINSRLLIPLLFKGTGINREVGKGEENVWTVFLNIRLKLPPFAQE